MSTTVPEESVGSAADAAGSDEGLLTPPSSPRADHYGSVSSPVSPAPETPNGAQFKDAKPKPKRNPFLFRLLGKKKKQTTEAALEPPTLSPDAEEQTPEPEIDWLENKDKKNKSGRLFGKFRNSKVCASGQWAIGISHTSDHSLIGLIYCFYLSSFRTHPQTGKTAASKAPKASWTKKKADRSESLAPKTASTPIKRGIFGKQQQEETATGVASDDDVVVATTTAGEAAAAAAAAASNTEPSTISSSTDVAPTEHIDDIIVEETYVTEEDTSGIDSSKSPKTTAQADPAALARRKAIIQDSWEFYRLICSLVCDRDRYLETFRTLQKDPVYPYLNSLTSVNDPGDVGYENFEKPVVQTDVEEYQSMSKLEVAQDLEQRARETLPQFVEVCKALAGSLGIGELGIGPVKDAATALRKAQRKYDGDLLKVTDYCRALIIVDDMAALLGLLELLRDAYGDLIRRVKLSTLNSDRPKIGG